MSTRSVPSKRPLYGHAAAIQALYQTAPAASNDEKPKRRGPRGGRMLRFLDALKLPVLRPAFAVR